MKEPTIEVRDKVRIVATGSLYDGEVGTVSNGPDFIGWFRILLGPSNHLWFDGSELALFADEPEDMPEDTVYTRNSPICSAALMVDITEWRCVGIDSDDDIRYVADAKYVAKAGAK